MATSAVGDEHPLGLYRDDCRFLSGHELRIAGVSPRLLVTSAITGAAPSTSSPTQSSSCRTAAARAADASAPRRSARSRTRRRCSSASMSTSTVAIRSTWSSRLALAADFRPMLVLRGLAGVPGRRADERGGGRAALGGPRSRWRPARDHGDRRPGARRGADGRLRFPLRLQPGQGADVVLTFRLDQGAARAGPHTAHPYRSAAAAAPYGRTGGPGSGRRSALQPVLERSMLDLTMLRSQLDGQTVLRGGHPLVRHPVRPRQPDHGARDVRSTRRSPSRRCACSRSGSAARRPVHEEEPGKVLHELRVGEVAALGLTPLARYYGTVDATALFVCLLAEHARWTGDSISSTSCAPPSTRRWAGSTATAITTATVCSTTAQHRRGPAQPGLEGFRRRHRRRARRAARAPDRPRRGTGLRRPGQARSRACSSARVNRARAELLREADEMEQRAGALLAR